MSLFKLTLKELQEKFTRGEISATEIARAFLLRLNQVESKIKAYVTLRDKDALLVQAKSIDQSLQGWRKTQPLMAMPLAIKDNICTKGLRTTCSSRILEDFEPPYDATVMARLNLHQPLILGKTNLDEFAMGSSTEHSAFGPSRNPWNPKFIPGGSSGGSAAAVAADECVAALGSDTGGSIRQPAACCGVVGFKPTYGRVSRYGLVAFASSLDQIGPITKTVTDAAILLNFIAGHDPLDSTSSRKETPDFTKSLKKKDVKRLVIGIPREHFADGLDPEVSETV
ncbi:MAG TPA: amidase family protein, partial [Nitrospirales bacterium]|nr:amidase family protein [Nitrospirales bacterium]